MNIDRLIEDLGSNYAKNSALEFLEKIVVDVDSKLISKLAENINFPSSIENTNRFVSLLVELPSDEYISPLVDMISKAKIGESNWLSDYLYALGNLLEDHEDQIEVNEELVNLLGFWLESTQGGEISWKSGIILAEIGNVSAEPYLLNGAKNIKLFSETRIACLRGYVNHNRSGKHVSPKALDFLKEMQSDSEIRIKEEAKNAIAWFQGV